MKLGLPRKNIFVTDLAGVVYTGRKELMDEDKIQFAQETSARTLTEVIADADVFLGLSAGGVLKPDMVKKMAANPLILALANPNPEISPEDAKAARPDCIMATGRTDYPNQVNNVLVLPLHLPRRARLRRDHDHGGDGDRGGARARRTGAGRAERGGGRGLRGRQQLSFGPEYLIPKPFDPRLMIKIAPAVAKAAAESGVAARPVKDMDAYREQLQSFVYASGTTMKPIFTMAKTRPRRSAWPSARARKSACCAPPRSWSTRAVARPTLIGRPKIIAERVEKFGLRLQEGRDYDVVNVEQDDRYRDFWQTYHRMTERKGVTVQMAKIEMRRRLTLIGAMLLHKGPGRRHDLRHLGHHRHPPALPRPGDRQARRASTPMPA